MIQNWIVIKFTKLALVITITLISCSAQAKHLLVYGDSLSAAYGMELEQGWVHLLGQALGAKYTVSNASISGETSAGGLARFEVTLEELTPDLIFIELGANDGLRGYPADRIKDNLDQIISMAKDSGAQVVLAGISIPPSFGPRYVDQFRSIFPNLAEQHKVPYIDLFEEDFFTKEGYIQADGLHPTAITQPLIRNTIHAFLKNQGLIE